MSELKNRVVSGLKWSATFRFASQIITWVSTIYVMRLLTPADYGLMALAGVFLGFMYGFKDLGIGSALIQRKELDEHLLGKSFGFVLLIGLALFFLGYFLCPGSSNVFRGSPNCINYAAVNPEFYFYCPDGYSSNTLKKGNGL